jgi:hypothetical protein
VQSVDFPRRFGGTCRFHLQGRRIVQFATCLLAGLLNYSSTLKMEAIRSSETSGTNLRTTRRHIPEDDTLHNHRCENLKSYDVYIVHKRSIVKEIVCSKEIGLCYNSIHFHDMFLLGISENSIVFSICIICD